MGRAQAPDEVLNITPDEGDKLRSKALAADSDDLPPGYYRSPRVVATFIAITLNLMGVYFGFLAAAATLNTIIADLGPSSNSSLFSTVLTTAMAISSMLMGRFTDRFGRRPFIIGTNVLGLLGAIIACTATRLETIIGANVLAGLSAGQAGGYPLFIGEIMSNKYKFIGTIIVAFPSLLATGLGPYFGQRLGIMGEWRWIYYIQVICFFIATVLSFIFYHPPSFVQLHGKKISKMDELKRFDWIGVLLLIASLSLFLLGISWGGQPGVGNSWTSPKILGLLISGAVSTVCLLLYENLGNVERPIIPVKLFRDLRGFTCIVLYSATMGLLNITLQIMYPLQVTRIFGSTFNGWEEIAWMSSTTSLGAWFGVITLGYFFHHIRHIRIQLLIGACWATAFLGAMSSITKSDKDAAIAFSFLAGIVIGWGQDVTMLLVQFITNDEDLGVGFAIVSGLRQVCGSIFTAAFIALYTNKLPGEIQSHVVPAVTEAGLNQSSIAALLQAAGTGDAQLISAVPGMTADILAVTNDALADSYAAAYAYVYYFAAALGVFVIGSAACSRDFDHYLTSHVSRRIYTKGEAAEDVLGSSDSSKTIDQQDPVGEKAFS